MVTMTENETTREMYNTNDRFRFFVTVFRIAGVSITSEKEPKLYILYSLFVSSCVFTLVIGCVADMWIYFDDMDHVFENARIVPPIINAVCIQIFFRIRRKAVVNLMNLTENFKWEDSPSRDPDTDYTTMSELTTRIKPFVKKFSILVIIYHTIYCVVRINVLEGKPLTINAYYFINTTVSPTYELANISQYVGATMCVTTFIGFLGFDAYLVAIACSQLEKLSFNLTKIGHIHPNDDSATESGQEEEGQMQLQKSDAVSHYLKIQVSNCVRHHQEIMKYMKALEDTLNPLFVGMFLLILSGMCAAAFSFVVSWGNFLQVSQAFVAYIVPLAQLYAVCWFGQELTDQAGDVAKAVWKSNWVGTPISCQRSLILIMFTSQRKFTLTAGKCVPVSRGTMENVFKQTVSLLMLLLKMKNKDVAD